jgi:small-conductance mechanosensitive channel
MEDSDFEENEVPTGPSSGTRTPMAYINEAKKGAKGAMTMVGDVAGKVAGDFTGKQVVQSNHPHQVVLMLLSTTSGSQVLARRLYRTFAREETETVYQDDLKNAFSSDDEADAAFQMFDRDLNGDISMEELEACCADVGRERKSITASLADLDSVVSKLDNVLFFVVLVITLLVFLSLISTSAAGALTSAGSTVLALSWLFSATAQEFLQSVIFVFIKHPFDVGDRVSIYGNTGPQLKGDDYFVKEISLLFTEFKKMEGQVVQAPNSYLNTLFILNMRRSGGLAEAIPVVIRFGTSLEQIEGLRNRLLEFVTAEKREYAQKILTELRDVTEVHSLTLNIVFFYKSNWQNELLRLQRRNKFICAMMVSMQELGIEGPRMRLPGQKNVPFAFQSTPGSFLPLNPRANGSDGNSPPDQGRLNTGGDVQPSSGILRRGGQGSTRLRGESMSAYSRRVDFSLGMRDMSAGDLMGDVHEGRSRPRLPPSNSSASPSRSQFRRASRDDDPIARTTSRDTTSSFYPSGLGRVSSDSQARLRTSQSQSTHRNRFFSRAHDRSSIDGPINDQPDLEAGGGMADIPESGPFSRSPGRLDPRTGLVSPQAIYHNDAPMVPVVSGGAGPQPAGPRPTAPRPAPQQQQQQPLYPPALTLSHVASQGNGIVDRQASGTRPIQHQSAEDYEMRRFS